MNVNENKQFFQFAIEQANEKLLKDEEFQLEGQVADITFGNEVSVSRALCGLLEVFDQIFNSRLQKFWQKIFNYISIYF